MMYVHSTPMPAPARPVDWPPIPGSMATPGYLVKGRGFRWTYNSASHGAGRPFSRTEAKRRFDKQAHDAKINELGIIAIGVGTDESYQAYKDIEHVMKMQEDLVFPIARLDPSVVIMGGKSDDGD